MKSTVWAEEEEEEEEEEEQEQEEEEEICDTLSEISDILSEICDTLSEISDILSEICDTLSEIRALYKTLMCVCIYTYKGSNVGGGGRRQVAGGLPRNNPQVRRPLQLPAKCVLRTRQEEKRRQGAANVLLMCC